ncbi:MAG: hypothetical protein ACRCV7_03265 [Culicoidibacterales bacterium]
MKQSTDVEIEVNRQAYNTDGNEKGNFVSGAKAIKVGPDLTTDLIEDVTVITNTNQAQTLIRTDVDSHINYKTEILQNQERGSNSPEYRGTSLNMTSYNVYHGDGSQEEKPFQIVVGVAGSAGTQDFLNLAPDWRQNFDPLLNRSDYNGKSDDELEMLLNEKRRVRTKEGDIIEIEKIDHTKVMYEIEMRQKMRELEKYRNDHISIMLTGDSKGSEDAAYLGLSFVKKTGDIQATELYLTNPKGIRVSDADYDVLKRMADEGKITVEIVYPEIVSEGILGGAFKTDGTGIGGGRPIPCRLENKFYTVPKDIDDTVRNHRVGDYEKNVYQGYDGKYKFQCHEKPKTLFGVGDGSSYVMGYEYSVSRIVKTDGTILSVKAYYFDEQKTHLLKLREHVQDEIDFLSHVERDEYEQLFLMASKKGKMKLKAKHKALIRQQTTEEMYVEDHFHSRGLLDELGISDVKRQLRSEFEDKLEEHVEEESESYAKIVLEQVMPEIQSFRQFTYDKAKQLRLYKEQLTEMIERLDKTARLYENSQDEVQMIMKRMKNK